MRPKWAALLRNSCCFNEQPLPADAAPLRANSDSWWPPFGTALTNSLVFMYHKNISKQNTVLKLKFAVVVLNCNRRKKILFEFYVREYKISEQFECLLSSLCVVSSSCMKSMRVTGCFPRIECMPLLFLGKWPRQIQWRCLPCSSRERQRGGAGKRKCHR